MTTDGWQRLSEVEATANVVFVVGAREEVDWSDGNDKALLLPLLLSTTENGRGLTGEGWHSSGEVAERKTRLRGASTLMSASASASG